MNEGEKILSEPSACWWQTSRYQEEEEEGIDFDKIYANLIDVKAYPLHETKGHLYYSLDQTRKLSENKNGQAPQIFNQIKITNKNFSLTEKLGQKLWCNQWELAAVRVYLGDIANDKTYRISPKYACTFRPW